ncbi:MAG: c-type cytochrome, partial [Pirellulaceae bacterium]
WMWKVQHPGGKREINELHLPVGGPVKLRLISEDVIHSLYVPAFRVKQDVLPARYTTMWFTPNRIGTYRLFCAEYCGTNHSRMTGRVIVMSPTDYAAWLEGRTRGEFVSGEQLFEQFRCNTCHFAGPGARGPALEGLFGSQVPLADGRLIEADENYLRESIVDPRAKVVTGFQPIMPTYQGQLGEEQILQLIGYIKSLAGRPRPAAPE